MEWSESDYDDEMMREKTMSRILDLAIRKRRRMKRRKRGYSLRDDFLQTRLISTLCSNLKEIMEQREKRRKAAEYYLKDLL
ncbi:unnamed protein product [Cylicocyclus nassatus]|uniref:Uncharacterized protein n=1 Tax=Cylicocyclus nassatus TaxID=53992 RepID=A0AA36M3C4_CYLNA|nr:unnamed protein product [Cylicocyclus nassatus]